MPKNLVRRLQNLENEINTMVSLYDASGQGSKSMKTTSGTTVAKSQSQYATHNGERSHALISAQSSESQTSPKSILITKRLQKEGRAKEPANYFQKNAKPSSAPSGVVPRGKEGELKRKRPYGANVRSPRAGEVGLVESSEWFDCAPNNYELADEAEKVLRAGEEIGIVDNHQYRPESFVPKRSTTWCAVCRKRIFDCTCRGKRCKRIPPPQSSPENSVAQDEAADQLKGQRADAEQGSLNGEVPRKGEKESADEVVPARTDSRKVYHHSREELARQHKQVDKSGSVFHVTCSSKCSVECKARGHNLAKQPSDSLQKAKSQDRENSPGNRYTSRPATAPAKSENALRTGQSPRYQRSEPAKKNEKEEEEEEEEEEEVLPMLPPPPLPPTPLPPPPPSSSPPPPPLPKALPPPSPRADLAKIPEELQQATSNNSLGKMMSMFCKETVSAAEKKEPFQKKGVMYVDTAMDTIQQTESNLDVRAEDPDDEDLAKIKHNKMLSDLTTRKIADIIEKNHERVEEMRRSRNAAYSMFQEIRDKYDAMLMSKKDLSDKLEMALERNDELSRELAEEKDTKQNLLAGWEKFQKDNNTGLLINKLKSVTEENKQCKEKIAVLENQIVEREKWQEEKESDGNFFDGPDGMLLDKDAELKPQHMKDRLYDYHVLFKRQEAANRKLMDRINFLEKVLVKNKEKEKRFSEAKAELKKRVIKTECQLQRMGAEKLELIKALNELRIFAEERQSKVESLQDVISKKDEELDKQKKLLEQKCDTLDGTNKELESIRKTSRDLEDQVRTLRKSIENFDEMHQNLLKERKSYEDLVQRIQDENGKLQEELATEKDSLLIKNKIIEDQQSTIKQLREKSDEMKDLLKKNESLDRLLNLEREEKLEMQETIEHLKWRKEELKQKVKSLEGDLLLAPQEVVRDLQRTQLVLHELENQVQIKQKEWEIHLQSLIREKEQACNVAAFATKKLMQTTSEFQRQSESHKKLYRMLAENLVEKERHFHEVHEKTKQSVKFSEDLLQRSNLSEVEEQFREELKRSTTTTTTTKKDPDRRNRYHVKSCEGGGGGGGGVSGGGILKKVHKSQSSDINDGNGYGYSGHNMGPRNLEERGQCDLFDEDRLEMFIKTLQ